jgi:hypothetical protein
VSGGRRIRDRARRFGPQPARGREPVWKRQACSACGRPCILAEEDTGRGRLKGALLEAAPAPGGLLVHADGEPLIRDPEFRLPGTRYNWHHCPVRNTP